MHNRSQKMNTKVLIFLFCEGSLFSFDTLLWFKKTLVLQLLGFYKKALETIKSYLLIYRRMLNLHKTNP